MSILTFLIALSIFTGVSIFLLTFRSIDLAKGDTTQFLTQEITEAAVGYSSFNTTTNYIYNPQNITQNQECASVEKMGDDFRGGFKEQSLRVRRIIQQHFDVNGNGLVILFKFDIFVFLILFVCDLCVFLVKIES